MKKTIKAWAVKKKGRVVCAYTAKASAAEMQWALEPALIIPCTITYSI
jgi:hypothetical protein